MLATAGELLTFKRSAFIYHMDNVAEREDMIRTLWSGDYRAAAGSVSRANSHLVELFSEQQLVQFDSASEGTQAAPRRYPRDNQRLPKI